MPRNLLVLAIGVFLDVSVTYAAGAADLAPVYTPPVTPPPYNWSGLYLGANLGGAWSNRTLNIAATAWDDPGSTVFEDVLSRWLLRNSSKTKARRAQDRRAVWR